MPAKKKQVYRINLVYGKFFKALVRRKKLPILNNLFGL